jgi:chitin synthase
MDFADVPPRLPGPALGFRNVTVNKPHVAEPHQNGDYLTTTIPLQPRANHVPVLSNRGAGIQWNLQAAQAPKPRPTREPLTMFRGNFCVDYPVPSRLLRQVPHSKSTRDEFNHMRYSAVTCDPVDFYAEQFTLRPTLFGTPRSTEIMIILTMYNEDEVLFARTLKGILTNIKDLASRDSEVWGKSSWKNIVVCIISDGRSKIHPRTRALLTLLGVYQEGRAKQRIHDKDITAHLYEVFVFQY